MMKRLITARNSLNCWHFLRRRNSSASAAFLTFNQVRGQSSNVNIYQAFANEQRANQTLKELLPNQKGLLVVKESVISFELTVDHRGTQLLKIIQYHLDGCKESEFALNQIEAEKLTETLEQMGVEEVGSRNRQTKLQIDESSQMTIFTTHEHIGAVCTIIYEKGLYEVRLTLPWSDVKNFCTLVTNSLMSTKDQ